MLNLKEITQMLEGFDPRQMSEAMIEMNEKLSRVIELLEQTVAALDKDSAVE